MFCIFRPSSTLLRASQKLPWQNKEKECPTEVSQKEILPLIQQLFCLFGCWSGALYRQSLLRRANKQSESTAQKLAEWRGILHDKNVGYKRSWQRHLPRNTTRQIARSQHCRVISEGQNEILDGKRLAPFEA